MTLIEWVFGIGGIVLGIGLAAYGFGYKLPGLWIGFFGSVALLLAFTLEIQALIQSATVSGASEPERPSVFVIGMSMAYAEGRVLDHGVMIPTVTEQPTVLITVRSVDRTAFDVDTASGF